MTVGTNVAVATRVGAEDFTDLFCWQLARELNLFVIPIAQRPAVQRNRKFCEQLEDAASSPMRNIAEGFGRFDHKEFANFMKIALASEFETRSNLIEALDKRYITERECQDGLRLTRRAITCAVRFREYLVRTPTPPRTKQKPRLPEVPSLKPKPIDDGS